MLTAMELKEGMAIRVEGQIYKVLAVESKAGTAKLGGVVKTKLISVKSGHIWEPHFRPNERLREVQLERRVMEFVFATGDTYTFMSPTTFEQVEIPKSVLAAAEAFFETGMQLPVEFFDGEPLSVIFPQTIDVRVADTAPPTHAQQETTWKTAKLENGLTVRVPMFIGPGEVVRVEVRTGRYLERVRDDRQRGA
jgi:elongation factor P